MNWKNVALLQLCAMFLCSVVLAIMAKSMLVLFGTFVALLFVRYMLYATNVFQMEREKIQEAPKMEIDFFKKKNER